MKNRSQLSEIGLVVLGLLAFAAPARAQEVEPRRWSHLPMGANFGGGAYVYTEGEIAFDPVLQIEGAKLDKHTGVIKYVRPFELFDKSARIDLYQGYSAARWKGLLRGEPAATRRQGITDTTLRFAVNLWGAPPLKGEEFREYRAQAEAEGETIVGAALVVQLPTGYYLEDRLLNLSSNRFTFRPQLGAVHNRGKWSFELTGSAWIFTENDEFFDGNRLEQDPIYALQSHVVYTFKPGLWIAAGAAYGMGGESTINGSSADDRRENAAWGASLGVPITKKLGVQIGYIGLRTQEEVGGDTDTFAAGFSLMW